MRTVRPVIGSRAPAPGDESITKGLAIRKAISYAINRAEINNVIHQDLHKIVDYPIYDKLGIWCNPNIIKYDYDLNEAKRYMKIAGYDIDYTPTIGHSYHFEIITALSITFIFFIKNRKRKKTR
jgi:ABC-type transport system substrate-binding protein